MTDFTLPELGENVTSGDVLHVLLKPGDMVANDQPVLELETDKATIEVPSSVAGRVVEVKVKVGDKVTVGQAILSVDDSASATEPSFAQTSTASKEAAPAPNVGGESATVAAGLPAVGPETRGPEGRPGKPDVSAPATQAADEPLPGRGRKVVDISRGGARPGARATTPEMPAAPATPSVRRMARELAVDINEVQGSGPGGRISIEDVKAHAKRIVASAVSVRPGGGVPAEPLPDFTEWGEVDRQPMRAVRRKTAEHLTAAWTTVPHVTQHDLADVTELEELRKRYAKPIQEAGGNLTITAILVKVVAAALRVFPQLNSSIDLPAGEIVYKKYVNIGVAVETDRGLLVPVIRDADAKNIRQLSVELVQLSEKARTRKISLTDMQGWCFSISNLGSLGGSFFTPIVNTPEVAILGVSRAQTEPVYSKETGGFAPRLMLPLSLSYDHRVVDGADGIRFLRWVVEALERPFLLALEG